MADAVDAYKVLQVDPEAEDEVIKAAYRRLARMYHPDLASGPEASLRMAAINAAWNLIGTPASRADYDRSRAAPAEPSAPDDTRTPDSGTQARHHRPAQPARPARPPGPDGPATGGRPVTPQPPPETVSRDWTSGRSSVGGGFDPSMRSPEGLGAAGPPPGRPSGSVLNFGRFSGWSLGEIARHDLEYIEWLDRAPIGRMYRDEVDAILRATGRRRSTSTEATERRGLFRRR
jgi:curved DNA-binding protein CbpA